MRSLKIKDKIWVQSKGRIYSIPAHKESANKKSETEQELIAPFSCKVLKIHVKSGQAVEKGASIVVVEAMKMEYSYTSPKAGTIADVLVKEGEVLAAGAKFIRWKEPS